MADSRIVDGHSRLGAREYLLICCLTLGAIIGVRLAGVTAAVPLPALVAVVVVGLTISGLLMFWEHPGTVWALYVRNGLQVTSATALMYVTGWGPVLAIGYAFIAAENIGLYGSQAATPCAVWTIVSLIGAEVAVAFGWAPSLLTIPYSHGLAGLMLIAELFVVRIVRGAAADREEAATAMANSEKRLRRLLSHAADAIVVLAPDRQIAFASDAIERLIGLTPDQLVGHSSLEGFVNPDDLAAIRHNGGGSFLSTPGSVYRGDLRLRFGDDEERWCHVTAANLFDDPAIGGILVNAHDISDRKRAEELLAGEAAALAMVAKGEPLADVLENIARLLDAHSGGAACIVRVFEAGRLRVLAAPSLPPEICRLFEVPVSDFPVRETDPAVGIVTDLHAHGSAATQVIGATSAAACWSLPIVLPGRGTVVGVITLLLDDAQPTDAQRDLVQRFVTLASVAIEQERARAELEYRAFHDDLTGLPNRVLLHDRLGQALQRARREAFAVAVLFLDLDRFKLVNDGLGHEAGDRLLVQIAQRLTSRLRGSDTVARLGGDEFIVIVDPIHSEDDVSAAVGRVTDALAEPFALNGETIYVTASIGVAIASDSAEIDDVLRGADDAMYVAKQRGRGTVEFQEMRVPAAAATRLARLTALHEAVDRGELEVHYQPIVALANGRVVGAEALVRWRHPQVGLLLPAEFVPLAEDSGLIVPIGLHVLADAIHRLREWPLLGVAVNVSARQLADADFVVRLIELLEATDPRRLTLEITETLLLDDSDAVAASLQRLHDLGVRIALDDFGTGYSSLSYLTRFPIGQLKIDRSFVCDLATRPEHETLVRGVIELGHALSLEVVAEGVETALQAQTLVRLGCRFAQGYYFGRPQRAEAVHAMQDARVSVA